jgi:hypothetical protein
MIWFTVISAPIAGDCSCDSDATPSSMCHRGDTPPPEDGPAVRTNGPDCRSLDSWLRTVFALVAIVWGSH